jgi:hypothetical protein
MQKYLISQVFSVIVVAVLVFTFYALLAANMMTNQNLLTPMILIIIAIVLIAIFLVVTRIEYLLGKGKRHK